MKGSTGDKKVDKLLLNLEQDVLDDIVRRLKAGKGITSSADWQINRLTLLGNGSQDAERMIKTAAGKTDAEMARLYASAANAAYTRDKDLYTAVGKVPVPYSQNGELQQLVHAISSQTAGTIQNITGSTGFMVKDATGALRFTTTSQIYTDYLDRNLAAMASGAFDYNTMIRKTVAELTNSGLRSVDYASGRSNRVDVAVRRAILTGYGQLTSRVTFFNAQQLGTDLFEVSWHPNARPEHQIWQGRVYTRRQLETVCGYGRVDGLCGANCRHVFYPFINGISKRQWSDEDLARYKLEENAKREFRGKEYTDYEATQEQRRLETQMRAYLERASLLAEADAEEGEIVTVKARIQALKERYRALSRFFKLPEQWERVA